jgi:hypothetical protein
MKQDSSEMNQELVDKLVVKYPYVFKKLKYIECCGGWFELIDSMCSLIEDYITKLPIELRDQVFAEQIKQKFGYLRIYFSKNISYIDGVIDMAEISSKYTCEDCGSHGELRSKDWVQVLCDNCFIDEKKRLKESYEAFRAHKKV